MARDGMLAGSSCLKIANAHLFNTADGLKASQVFSNTTYFSITTSVYML